MRVLVTGSTDGLGLEVARELASRGDEVLVHGRDRAKLERAAEEVGATSAHLADLAALAQVRQLAGEIDHVDVLVNNAGVISAERRLSEDGYELGFAVNYVAGFLLTELLGERAGRVVNVASGAQQAIDFDDVMLESGYEAYRSYAQSKLAQVMHAFELAERGRTANALHPATLMDTKMVRESFGRVMSDVREGAEATISLIDRDDVSGRYFNGTRDERAHEQAYDGDARRRLWELSERLVA